MENKFDAQDLKFLRALKVADAPRDLTPPKTMTTEQLGQAVLESVKQMTPQEKAKFREHLEQRELDGTCRLLLIAGLPITPENWLRLAFAGNPPTPPFDGELAEALPDWVRRAFEEED